MSENPGETPGAASGEGGLFHRMLARFIDVRPRELPALLWSWAYIFTMLSSYYVMRPICTCPTPCNHPPKQVMALAAAEPRSAK